MRVSMSPEPRCYHTAYMILGINVLAALLAVDGEAVPAVFSALWLDPGLVRRGEAWRLLTYAFLPDSGFLWTLLYKFFAYVFFGRAVEQLWGTRRFLTLYGISTVGAGLVATVLGIGLAGGGLPEAVIFFAFGMLFPEARIMLLFLPLPIPARILTLALTGAYFVNALTAKLAGVPIVAGLACGAGYVLAAARPSGWVRRIRRRVAEKVVPDVQESLARLPTERLEEQVRRIVKRRLDDDRISEEEARIVETFIQRIDPGKELCSPDPAAGPDGMCPPCREMGVCLRRFLEQRRITGQTREP